MKVSIQELETCKRLLEVEVPVEVVVEKFDQVYREIKKTASIPGFRVGKVPRHLLELHYGEIARDEVLKRLVPQSYTEAIRQNNLVPVNIPEITDVKFEIDKPLYFKAKVDIKPNISLKRYKGLKVRKKKVSVSEEDVKKSLAHLQEQNAEFRAVEDRPLKLGDYCACDLESFVDGKPIDKKEKILLLVERESVAPGFADQMIGAQVGETKEVEVTLPKDFHNPEYAGRPATFKVYINQIKQKRLLRLDDEFAKDLGKFQTLGELKEAIRKGLISELQSQIKAEMEGEILDQLLRNSSFEVPSSLVKRQLARLVEDAKKRLLYEGLKKEDIESQEKLLQDKLRETSTRQVKISLILDEIADWENITISDGELEDRITLMAKVSNQQVEKLRNYLQEKDLVDNLRHQLREQKTIDFLLTEARVEEQKGGE